MLDKSVRAKIPFFPIESRHAAGMKDRPFQSARLAGRNPIPPAHVGADYDVASLFGSLDRVGIGLGGIFPGEYILDRVHRCLFDYSPGKKMLQAKFTRAINPAIKACRNSMLNFSVRV
jgi:hypothetical protein